MLLIYICCRVLQCTSMCSSASQCATKLWRSFSFEKSTWQSTRAARRCIVCCRVLQCVAVRCSALQCVAVRCHTHAGVATAGLMRVCVSVCVSMRDWNSHPHESAVQFLLIHLWTRHASMCITLPWLICPASVRFLFIQSSICLYLFTNAPSVTLSLSLSLSPFVNAPCVRMRLSLSF